jgi:transposase
VLDPEVVQKLTVRHSSTEPVTRLTPRERGFACHADVNAAKNLAAGTP